MAVRILWQAYDLAKEAIVVHGVIAMSVADELMELFRLRGGLSYGEQVTVEQHSLQAAFFAEQAGEDDEMIVAALVHDVGHLLHDMGENIADHGVDSEHENIADPWLKARFPLSVSESARLHVAAKRYLCATNPEYLENLSEASLKSLNLQGGPMDENEAADFSSGPFFDRALALRYFDDLGKEPDLVVPSLEHYREKVEAVCTSNKEGAVDVV